MTSAALLTPALAAIHERRSIRSYTSEPVPHETVERLLDAAVWAPSAMNTQPWSFVVVQDPELLDRFETEAAEPYRREPPEGELATLPPDQLAGLRDLINTPGFGIFHGAPAVIVIYSSSELGIPDCYLAAQNLMLAATTLGLGSCPIGLARPFFDEATVKAELGVPVTSCCALPVVVGTPQFAVAPTPRDAPDVLWR